MAKYPADLKYTKDHEWARLEGELVRIGITEYAVEQLGDVTLVDLPALGAKLKAAAHFGDIESVKAVSELFAPASGKVLAVNDALVDTPETVAADCYGAGWLIKIEVTKPSDLTLLRDAAGYRDLIANH